MSEPGTLHQEMETSSAMFHKALVTWCVPAAGSKQLRKLPTVGAVSRCIANQVTGEIPELEVPGQTGKREQDHRQGIARKSAGLHGCVLSYSIFSRIHPRVVILISTRVVAATVHFGLCQ